ncbi:MAG: hypothetical protein ACRDQ5_08065 [Sciscionella sp.]
MSPYVLPRIVIALHTMAKLAGDHGGMGCGTNEIMTGLAAKTSGYTR